MITENLLLQIVKGEIEHFNGTRGRRKELSPSYLGLDDVLRARREGKRCQKFGLIIAPQGYESSSAEPGARLGRVTVRTLLRRKPRPKEIHLSLFRHWQGGLRIRLVVMRGKGNQKGAKP